MFLDDKWDKYWLLVDESGDVRELLLEVVILGDNLMFDGCWTVFSKIKYM